MPVSSPNITKSFTTRSLSTNSLTILMNITPLRLLMRLKVMLLRGLSTITMSLTTPRFPMVLVLTTIVLILSNSHKTTKLSQFTMPLLQLTTSRPMLFPNTTKP